MKKIFHSKKGFSLLEIVLAVAIFSAGSISVGYLMIDSLSATDINNKKITATFLAREGLAVVRSIRDDGGFEAIGNGTYGISFDEETETWSLVGAPDVSEDDLYTRTITISSVDAYTKEINSTVTVSSFSRDLSVSLTTQLTDWR